MEKENFMTVALVVVDNTVDQETSTCFTSGLPMIFEGHEVEILELNGEVLFNPKHVAECLDIADVKSSIRDFNSNQVIKVTNSSMHGMHFRILNNTGENFLTESGVYKLIFKSRKPEAEKFQDWVTDIVLPSIRKTGVYMSDFNRTKTLEFIVPEIEAAGRLASFFGLEGNELKLKANKVIRNQYNVDCMELLDLKGLESPDQKQYFTVSYIGLNCFNPPIAATVVNKKLKEAGLQIETRGLKDKLIWVMTEAGKEYGNLIDVDVNSKDNPSKKKTNVQQLKWIAKVATLIGGKSI